MGNNINFNELWARRQASAPGTNDLLSKLDQFKKKNLRKLIIANVLLILTTAFIIFIWIYYHPQLLTTKIGIVVIILAMTIYILRYNQSMAGLKNINNSQSNSEYLKNLLSIKRSQNLLQTKMLTLYFFLFSAGIGLYMYESVLKMTFFGGIITYVITLAWILFNWFYLRPKQIKKQQIKLDDIINKFEIISKQLDE